MICIGDSVFIVVPFYQTKLKFCGRPRWGREGMWRTHADRGRGSRILLKLCGRYKWMSPQPYYGSLYYPIPTARFRPTASHEVSTTSVVDRSRPVSCEPTQTRPCQHSCQWMPPVDSNTIWRWSANSASAITQQDGRRRKWLTGEHWLDVNAV